MQCLQIGARDIAIGFVQFSLLSPIGPDVPLHILEVDHIVVKGCFQRDGWLSHIFTWTSTLEPVFVRKTRVAILCYLRWRQFKLKPHVEYLGKTRVNKAILAPQFPSMLPPPPLGPFPPCCSCRKGMGYKSTLISLASWTQFLFKSFWR